MDKLSYINWSEVIRQSIIKTIEEERRKRIEKKDFKRIREASMMAEEISEAVGGSKSEEVIREWRDKNWEL
ncbi:VapB-type antitoxin [Candidatus Acidianus copahuensis]|uniref:VapB-type antitoxin n=1 Tax=Candidatus Acidianus copahuensis TaxID=1160895 RepID=A0A031LPB9_9CREN|nr:hypothetical protein [Candidatus Acidianus copahuensis]EZQ10227.1 VapB-type antitoxin [Candidatus Acidianus copahuensis]